MYATDVHQRSALLPLYTFRLFQVNVKILRDSQQPFKMIIFQLQKYDCSIIHEADTLLVDYHIEEV